MEIHKKGIAVAGSLIADVVYTLDTYPKEGLLANICDTKYNVGGCGNLILDLAQIDPQLPVRVSAVIGADSLGQMLWDKLSCYKNIQLHNITREGASSITYVMNPQDTKQRTFFSSRAPVIFLMRAILTGKGYRVKFLFWNICF